MNPDYARVYRALQATEILEKTAALEDREVVAQSILVNAVLSDNLYNDIVKLAGTADPVDVIKLVMDMRTTHHLVHEKQAQSAETVADCMHKLATTIFVDGVLTDTLTKVSSDEWLNVRLMRTLGREYAVNLMRGLLT